MNLQEYQEKALQTESRVESIKFNEELVVSLFKLFITNTELLDAIKKEVFYNKSEKLNTIGRSSIEDIEDIVNDLPHQFANRTSKSISPVNTRVFHGILGIATEAGELLEVLLKNITEGQEIDVVNVQEELADISWYTAILNDELGLNWEEGLIRNIKKLQEVRFKKKKFTEDDANNRDLEKERLMLEGK